MPRKPQTSTTKSSLVFPNEPATVIEPTTNQESDQIVGNTLTPTVTNTRLPSKDEPPTMTTTEFNPYELLYSIPAPSFIIQVGMANIESQSMVWIERDGQKFDIGKIYVVGHMIASEVTQTAKRLTKETLLNWGTLL